jgi:pyruvate dehydrogenase E2 component (dihydrolipoamide acetyltransferase)
MKVEMKMPDLSTAGTTVKVIGWLIQPGQEVRQGQPLLEVETDKATMEVEAYVSGTLREIIAPQDTDVEVGQAIAVIETLEAEPEPAPHAVLEKPAASAPAQPTPMLPVEEARPRGMFSRNRQKAAELAVETRSESIASQAVIQDPSLNQRVVGQRMLESKQTIPHFYLQTSANAGPMTARRSAAAAASAGAEKPAWDAFFACAVGKAMQKYPHMRASFQDGKIVPAVDAVGIAVDLDGELFVAPIAQPGAKSPEAVSSEIRQMVNRLKASDPEARKIHPASFTISNLGATGIETFTAIINPPEAAILAIGKIGPVVVAVDGQAVIQQRVNLTLSVDHRVVNGRYAAEFLQCIVSELESF